MKMKISYIVAIVTIPFLASVTATYCDNRNLGVGNVETFCLRENGQSADCRGSLYNVKKAFIKCKNGYYNENNITLQELECNEHGEWSNRIMVCNADCENIEYPDNVPYPQCYREIKINRLIEATDKMKKNNYHDDLIGIADIFEILRDDNYFNNSEMVTSLKIRELYFDLNLFYSIIRYDTRLVVSKDKRNPDTTFRHLLTREFHTKNDICFNKTTNTFISISKNLLGKVFEERRCLPDYDDPNVELLCFNEDKSYTLPFKLTECKKQHAIIMVKCRLGMRIKHSEKELFLGLCTYGAWVIKDFTCEHICGQTDKDYIELQTPLVYNGIKTDISKFPWHVAIFRNSSSRLNTSATFENICGGTIIHSNIIISAAHCFYNNEIAKVDEASKYLVGAGKNYRNFNAMEKNAFFTGIKEIHIAQNYYPPEFMNDISVIILKEHLTYSSHIKPACINFSNFYNEYFIKSETEGHVLGWGEISESGDISDELITTKLSILSMDQCKNLIKANLRNQILGGKFCAINRNNSTACRGDSGGGFVVEENFGYGKSYYLKGIVSTTLYTNNANRYGSCKDGYITAFTNIQFYQHFIKSVILKDQLSQYLSENVTVKISGYDSDPKCSFVLFG